MESENELLCSREVHLNNFLPKGVRAVDLWMAYCDEGKPGEYFAEYVDARYSNAMLAYRTWKRLTNGR